MGRGRGKKVLNWFRHNKRWRVRSSSICKKPEQHKQKQNQKQRAKAFARVTIVCMCEFICFHQMIPCRFDFFSWPMIFLAPSNHPISIPIVSLIFETLRFDWLDDVSLPHFHFSLQEICVCFWHEPQLNTKKGNATACEELN